METKRRAAQTILGALILMIGLGFLLLLSGCFNPYKPLEPLPSLLSPAPEDIKLRPTVTDYDILVYAHAAKLILSGRVANLERGDLAAALATSGLAATSAILGASGVDGAAIAALVAVGAMINNVAVIVNPAIRANALSTGNNLVLAAEGRYFKTMTAAGVGRVSRRLVTPWGGQLLDDVNAAISDTNQLLVGLMPTRTMLTLGQPPSDPVHPNAAELASKINAEQDSPRAEPPGPALQGPKLEPSSGEPATSVP